MVRQATVGKKNSNAEEAGGKGGQQKNKVHIAKFTKHCRVCWLSLAISTKQNLIRHQPCTP